MLKTSESTSSLLPRNFSASFVFCHKPGCSVAETITKQNAEQLYAASRYPISQEVGGLLYAILLMPQLSSTSPSLWFGKGSMYHFPEYSCTRTFPPLPRSHAGGKSTPEADFAPEKLSCSSLHCRAGSCLQD